MILHYQIFNRMGAALLKAFPHLDIIIIDHIEETVNCKSLEKAGVSSTKRLKIRNIYS